MATPQREQRIAPLLRLVNRKVGSDVFPGSTWLTIGAVPDRDRSYG